MLKVETFFGGPRPALFFGDGQKLWDVSSKILQQHNNSSKDLIALVIKALCGSSVALPIFRPCKNHWGAPAPQNKRKKLKWPWFRFKPWNVLQMLASRANYSKYIGQRLWRLEVLHFGSMPHMPVFGFVSSLFLNIPRVAPRAYYVFSRPGCLGRRVNRTSSFSWPTDHCPKKGLYIITSLREIPTMTGHLWFFDSIMLVLKRLTFLQATGHQVINQKDSLSESIWHKFWHSICMT